MDINIFGRRSKKIKLGLPEPASPRIIIEEPHGEQLNARLHLRVPIEICDSMNFEKTRRQARLLIKDLDEHHGLTELGMRDMLAAMIFEIIDQNYTGG